MKLIVLKPNGDKVEITNVVSVWATAPHLEIDLLPRPPWVTALTGDEEGLRLKDPNLQLQTGELIAIG